jgi:hypothetical protein
MGRERLIWKNRADTLASDLRAEGHRVTFIGEPPYMKKVAPSKAERIQVAKDWGAIPSDRDPWSIVESAPVAGGQGLSGQNPKLPE